MCIGIVGILMLMATSSIVSADDNETVKKNLDAVFSDLAKHQADIFNDISRLELEEGYSASDPAIKALDNAACGLTDPINAIHNIIDSIEVPTNLPMHKDILTKFFEKHQSLLQVLQQLLKLKTF